LFCHRLDGLSELCQLAGDTGNVLFSRHCSGH
jgi:hypothetical protein